MAGGGVTFYPYEKGGGDFCHAEGGGGEKVVGYFFHGSLKF